MQKLTVKTYVSKKSLRYILIAVSCVLALIIALMCIHAYKCKDYVSVNAQIVDTMHEYDDDDSHAYYLTVKYEYDGAEYTANKRVTGSESRELNSFTEVRCNPENPSEIENTYAFGTMVGVAVFLGFFIAFLILALIKGERAPSKKAFSWNRDFHQAKK